MYLEPVYTGIMNKNSVHSFVYHEQEAQLLTKQ